MSYIVPSPLIYQQLNSSGGVLNSTPDLETCIIGPAYNVVPYVVGSSTSLAATYSGLYSTGATSNLVFPTASPGQIVDQSSIEVWLNQAVVEKLNASGTGAVLNSVITLSSGASMVIVGRSDPSGTNLLVSGGVPSGFSTGDSITIPGGGDAGADLVTTIVAIATDRLSIDIDPGITTEVTNVTVTKPGAPYLNSLTGTPYVEVGDTLVISSGSNSLTTQVLSVDVSGSNLQAIHLSDVIPSSWGKHAIGSMTSGGQVIATTGGTGSFASSDNICISGAGTNGVDLYTTVSSISSNNINVAGTALVSVSHVPVTEAKSLTVSVRKTYYDKKLPITDPVVSGVNYALDQVTALGTVTVEPTIHLTYGKVLSANAHLGYRALRQDLLGSILAINDVTDLESQLGDTSDSNPLGLACKIALANTVTRIRAISVGSDDLAGYLSALELSEAERLYCLVPLTQDLDILMAFKAHVVQMSTPEKASWRVVLTSPALASFKYIGQANVTTPNTDSANRILSVGSYANVLQSPSATFVGDGVVAGDTVVIVSSSDNTLVGTTTVSRVLSNQQIQLSSGGTGSGTNVTFYIKRFYTKSQQAANIAAQSTNFTQNRVINVQPSVVGVSVNGVTKYLPGYYLAAGVGGMSAGFPVQQGFTNIGVAGITDLKYSNYYFSKTDLNTAAQAGTFWFVQDTQGGVPYCRHELTTDVSALEYREYLVVKNWDFLSYTYYDKIKPFIGSWNITTDTINSIRQTLIATSEMLKAQKLPKIGAPLLGYTIVSLAQDTSNKDTLKCTISISIVYPLNYLSLTLAI